MTIAPQVGGFLRRPSCWLLLSSIVGQSPSEKNRAECAGRRVVGRPARACPSARKIPPEMESLGRRRIGCPTRCEAVARTADRRSDARDRVHVRQASRVGWQVACGVARRSPEAQSSPKGGSGPARRPRRLSPSHRCCTRRRRRRMPDLASRSPVAGYRRARLGGSRPRAGSAGRVSGTLKPRSLPAGAPLSRAPDVGWTEPDTTAHPVAGCRRPAPSRLVPRR